LQFTILKHGSKNEVSYLNLSETWMEIGLFSSIPYGSTIYL
jgi:hypothetical protein